MNSWWFTSFRCKKTASFRKQIQSNANQDRWCFGAQQVEVGPAREQALHVQAVVGRRALQALPVDAEHGALFRRVAARGRRLERQRFAGAHRHAHHADAARLPRAGARVPRPDAAHLQRHRQGGVRRQHSFVFLFFFIFAFLLLPVILTCWI